MSDTQQAYPAPVPGWYPDGQGNTRYWDGTQWGAYAPAPVPMVVTLVKPHVSSVAVIGFVVSLLWVFLWLLPSANILIGIVALCFGLGGLSDTKHGTKRGRGLAIAAIVIGALDLIAGVLGVIALGAS